MKSKLNKQQKKYIKACDSKELRKVFKKFFKKENRAWIEFKNQEIVFKNNMFTTDNPFIIEFLNGLSVTQLEKTTETPNAKSLTKETLESLTNPDLIEKRKEFHNAIDEHIEKEEIIKLSNSHNGPMEFCVKITNVNKDILQNIYNTFHKDKSGILDTNRFLHSNSLHTYCYSSNVTSNYFKKVELIPTDEFLRYIGKEHLIENPKTLEFDLPKTSNDKGNIEAKTSNFVGSPLYVYILENIQKLIENKVEYDSVGKFILGEIYKMILFLEKSSETNIYTEEDMLNCFNEAREHKNFYTSDLKFESFASYLNSLK